MSELGGVRVEGHVGRQLLYPELKYCSPCCLALEGDDIQTAWRGIELGIHEVKGIFSSLKGTVLGLPAGEVSCPLSPGLLFAQQHETNARDK